MSKSNSRSFARRALLGASVVALSACWLATSSQSAGVDATADHQPTATPIKHLIVLIGENRSFDHTFATYTPPSGDSIKNLLSQGIIKADGSPGPNFALAKQFKQQAVGGAFLDKFFISLPSNRKTPFTTLPVPGQNFAPGTTETVSASNFATNGVIPPFDPSTSKSVLAGLEPSLEQSDLNLLTTGATGLTGNFLLLSQDVDSRIANFNNLANGPFPLKGATPGALPYDSYTGDTTHRLYEMWQQSDCNVANATKTNPSGCLNDLYPYVITSYTGLEDNGGSNSMAFYNMAAGDAPILKKLADQFTISDNFHQSGQGGTAINHAFLGTGDDWFWSDGHGNPTTPPPVVIANPDPKPGTDNVYKVDEGFNGNFTNCSDATQPGVPAVLNYLESLNNEDIVSNCVKQHFYMINNDSPGFLPNGTVDTAGIASGFSIPPQTVRTIGEALNEKKISWAYYGGAYNAAVALANNPTSTDVNVLIGQTYCNICNFESYASAIMGDPAQRTAHIKDATDFFAAIDNEQLPSVSFVKPDGLLDGHPASSKLTLLEHMIEKIVDHLNQHPEEFAETAFMITMDEGGGYWDSGYIQPLDFFGDGPRIPLIVVSPFTRGGHVNHSYGDHVSILKFIERNWQLKPLTERSRDNFPNPHTERDNPYVPVNSPALSDLFDMFDFDRHDNN